MGVLFFPARRNSKGRKRRRLFIYSFPNSFICGRSGVRKGGKKQGGGRKKREKIPADMFLPLSSCLIE